MAKKKIKITPIVDNEVTDLNYYDDHMYITNSKLKLYLENPPRKFQHLIDCPPKPSAAMKFGTAFHMLVLEDKEFSKHYAVEPDSIDKRTTLGKATLLKFNESLNGREAVPYKDFSLMQSMNANLKVSKNYSLLENCNQFEKIYLWKNETLDILCKGKLDAVNTRDKYIVDLKTTRDASPKAFKETIINQKYHMQAAFYCDALGYKDYYIYAIEKSKPHCICVYKISEDLIKMGRDMYIALIKHYKKYVEGGEVPTDYFDNKIFELGKDDVI
jgi:hypothetical protein|tara:strand:+ start:1870 stop:2685 length:816 start_codon:yes stop_codon:yes gene_type:complete